jgi:hypothetical protein
VESIHAQISDTSRLAIYVYFVREWSLFNTPLYSVNMRKRCGGSSNLSSESGCIRPTLYTKSWLFEFFSEDTDLKAIVLAVLFWHI